MTAVARRVRANGLSFTVDELGDGDAVAICLHGFPESRVSWRSQLPMLAAAGYRAIAPDLRGYGGSDRPKDREAYHIDCLVDDVAALFDAFGARRRLLIGHDWGGLIAWVYAMRPPRPLDGLIVMNAPHPAVFRTALQGSWAQRRRSWYVALFQLPWLPEAIFTARGALGVRQAFLAMTDDKTAFPEPLLDHYRRNALGPGAMTAMLNYYRANVRALFETNRTSSVIDTPTLLVWGEKDKALGLELTGGYEPYVSNMTLARLPGVSHWVQQEAPDAVNDVVQSWLKAQALWGGR